MKIFDRFKKKPAEQAPKTVAPTEEPKAQVKKSKTPTKTEKELATERGEPWVSVVKVDLDPDNIGNGAFELDWNEKFIVNLVRQGYQSKPGEDESAIVDRWFQDVCRNVVQENYEQWEANQPLEARPRVLDRKDLGDGKTEIS
jgi:hypothetical protein